MSVTVEPYNSEWPQQFGRIKARLETFLQGVPYISIEHVGSTSVPGLAAKPIIDIDIIITFEQLQPVIDALTTNGNFAYLGDLGIADRYVFTDPDQSPRRNLYACIDGASQTRNHLGLRDTLRKNAELRNEYAAVKLELAAKGTNLMTYIAAKNEIVQKILEASGALTTDELTALRKINTRDDIWGAIKIERLLLREFEQEDIQGYYNLESNEENARYQDWTPRTMEQARELVLANVRNRCANPRVNWEFVVEKEGSMIGRVGAALREEDSGDARKHFGVWFSFLPSVQGTGYATEAVTVLMDELEKRYKKDGADVEFEIECDPRNVGSWKLAERLGFEKKSFEERAWESKGEWVGSVVYKKVV